MEHNKKGDFWYVGARRYCTYNYISFIIVEFSFHAEKKKFIVWRSKICFLALELENRLFSNSRSGK